MNDKTLELLKSTYEQKKKERDIAEDHYCDLLNMKDRMEKNPKIIKYLKLLEEIENYNVCFPRNEELLNKSFQILQNHGYFIDTNEIYFYCGSFATYKDDIIQVPRNSVTREYDLYKDIESCKYIKSPVEEREEFESTHKVIVFYKPYPSSRDFANVHKEFLSTSVSEGQEVACNKVLSRKY